MSTTLEPITPVSTTALAKLSGISYRILDYWSRHEAIAPSVGGCGSGCPRVWTEAEIAVVMALGQVYADFITLRLKMPLGLVRDLWDQLCRDGHAIVALPTLTIDVTV